MPHKSVSLAGRVIVCLQLATVFERRLLWYCIKISQYRYSISNPGPGCQHSLNQFAVLDLLIAVFCLH